MNKEEIKSKNEHVEVKDSKIKKCDKDCEVFSRVVGYYRPTRQWHAGKQEEFRLRNEYDEKKTMKHKFKDEKTGKEPDKGTLIAFEDGSAC